MGFPVVKIFFKFDEESQENGTLGKYLEQKRKALGIALQEVSENTRIGIPYLKNIDKGEFDRLPCMPYSRGFVCAYAAYIGLDTDAIAKRFISEVDLETT